MDAELERRWRRGRPPFDGVTISVEELVPLSTLRQALTLVVEPLEAHWPGASLPLLHDWHQHDGVILPPRAACAWTQVRQFLASDESLYGIRSGDTYVRIGLYPEDLGFYLRIYPEDESDADDRWADHLGDFDLTCQPSLAAAVTERLSSLCLSGLRSGPAKLFFDASWAGRPRMKRL